MASLAALNVQLLAPGGERRRQHCCSEAEITQRFAHINVQQTLFFFCSLPCYLLPFLPPQLTTLTGSAGKLMQTGLGRQIAAENFSQEIPPDNVQVFLCSEEEGAGKGEGKGEEGVENVQSFSSAGALLYKVLTLYPSFSGHKKDIIKSLEKQPFPCLQVNDVLILACFGFSSLHWLEIHKILDAFKRNTIQTDFALYTSIPQPLPSLSLSLTKFMRDNATLSFSLSSSLCASFVFYDGTKKSTPLGDFIREKKTMGKVFVKSPL